MDLIIMMRIIRFKYDVKRFSRISYLDVVNIGYYIQLSSVVVTVAIFGRFLIELPENHHEGTSYIQIH